jgi:hypothetical protein
MHPPKTIARRRGKLDLPERARNECDHLSKDYQSEEDDSEPINHLCYTTKGDGLQ